MQPSGIVIQLLYKIALISIGVGWQRIDDILWDIALNIAKLIGSSTQALKLRLKMN